MYPTIKNKINKPIILFKLNSTDLIDFSYFVKSYYKFDCISYVLVIYSISLSLLNFDINYAYDLIKS